MSVASVQSTGKGVVKKGVCPAMKGRRTGMVVVEDESLKVCADVKKRQSHNKEKELDYPPFRKIPIFCQVVKFKRKGYKILTIMIPTG